MRYTTKIIISAKVRALHSYCSWQLECLSTEIKWPVVVTAQESCKSGMEVQPTLSRPWHLEMSASYSGIFFVTESLVVASPDSFWQRDGCPCPVIQHRIALPCTCHHSHRRIISITEKSSSHFSLKNHGEDPGPKHTLFCYTANHFLSFVMNISQLKWGETARGRMTFFCSNTSDRVNISS